MLNFPRTDIEVLSKRFETFLLDQYGVLHNGQTVFPGVHEALQNLQKAKKKVILLSNSAKRAEKNYQRMEQLGLDRQLFQAVVTSGEVGHYLFTRGLSKLGLQEGARCWVIARDGDRSPLVGSTLQEVLAPNDAEVLILSGSRGEIESWESAIKRLELPLARKLPCVCLNPDKWMLTPRGLAYGAGKIAEYYESEGGQVMWVGKPYEEMYKFAEREYLFEKGSAVAIGDSIEHDIQGAKRFGIAGAWVREGILREASDQEINTEIEKHDAVPDFQMNSFHW
jgi:HAD superfamily hydrolase (TIGR01459 family)